MFVHPDNGRRIPPTSLNFSSSLPPAVPWSNSLNNLWITLFSCGLQNFFGTVGITSLAFPQLSQSFQIARLF